MKWNYLSLFFSILLLASSCSDKKDDLLGTDVRLFEETPVWELAKAVKNEDTAKIRQFILEHKSLVNYQEPKFGESLLLWAVWTNHYKSSKALLENGADPNLQDNYNGNSALMHAAEKYDTSNYLKLLLQYKGNPNAIAKNDSNNIIGTPLIAAAGARIESVKLLVDAGANINYSNKQQQSALSTAFTFKKVDIVSYLLIEKNADYTKSFGKTVQGEPITIVNLLRTWTFPLNSKEYQTKMEIVTYLKSKGVDYWKAPIPKYYFKNYPKEYLDKY